MGVYGKVPIELKRVIQLVDPQSPTMEKEVITPVHKHYKYLNVFAPVLGQSLLDLQQNWKKNLNHHSHLTFVWGVLV